MLHSDLQRVLSASAELGVGGVVILLLVLWTGMCCKPHQGRLELQSSGVLINKPTDKFSLLTCVVAISRDMDFRQKCFLADIFF